MAKNKQGPSTKANNWHHRKAQLQTLLDCRGDDEEEGIALDRVLHEHNVISQKTKNSLDIEKARFSDKDLTSFGPLAEAQFGTVELVNCRLDGRVYVRKRVSKKFALKTREQFSFQTERHILLLALKSHESVSWTPQMLCAYQCPTYLNIVMEYAAGGSLWDVLESSGEGRLSPSNLSWWAPQCVAAITWLHSRAGFAHRDIKPHNFVVRPGPDSRLLLIDFGSAAQLLAPDHEGVQRVPRQNCLVPCGTCDYISPEVLQAHEEALVALEMSNAGDEDDSDVETHAAWKGRGKILHEGAGYGRETDWWSLGAMLYEMAYGVAPFFANDIRQTYSRIMNHENHLRFDRKIPVPPKLVDLIKSLLTHHEKRLGRYSSDEVREHVYFSGIDWTSLHTRAAPTDLLLPQFTYTTPLAPPDLEGVSDTSGDASKPFAFSRLFQSSVGSPSRTFLSQNQTIPETPGPAVGRRSFSRSNVGSVTDSARRSVASFIGFSWGPPKDAFDDATRVVPAEPASAKPGLEECAPSFYIDTGFKNPSLQYPLVTPMKPSRGGTHGAVPPSTVRVTSVRRSAQSRPVSDREAMRMLVDCVGMSARKRVLESGKKPKILPQFGVGFAPPPPIMNMAGLTGDDSTSGKFGTLKALNYTRSGSCSRSEPRSSVINSVRKELRFDDTTTQILPPNLSYSTFSNTLSRTNSSTTSSSTTNHGSVNGNIGQYATIPSLYTGSDSASTSSETEGPPSPSPSPRPGSAMSMLSMSRRSATPTVSSTYMMSGSSTSGHVRSGSETQELQLLRTRSGSLGSLGTVLPTNNPAAMAGAAALLRATGTSSQQRGPERERRVQNGLEQREKQQERMENGKVPTRRAHFADATDSSTGVSKPKAPATPHPTRSGATTATTSKSQLKSINPIATPMPKREARFEIVTPKPRSGTRFAVDEVDDQKGDRGGDGQEDGAVAFNMMTPKPRKEQQRPKFKAVQGTPHPAKSAKTNPLPKTTTAATTVSETLATEARTKKRVNLVASTPARVGTHRKTVGAVVDEGEDEDGGMRRRGGTRSDSDNESTPGKSRDKKGKVKRDDRVNINRLAEAETEKTTQNRREPDTRSKKAGAQKERANQSVCTDCRERFGPNGVRGGRAVNRVDQTYEEEEDYLDTMLDVMDRRYSVLRSEISRFEVQLQNFASRAQVRS